MTLNVQRGKLQAVSRTTRTVHKCAIAALSRLCEQAEDLAIAISESSDLKGFKLVDLRRIANMFCDLDAAEEDDPLLD